MQPLNIVTEVNLQTAALVRKGFLDGRLGTGQFEFWQKLHTAAVKTLASSNVATLRLPYHQRHQQITISSRANYRHKIVTNQFGFRLHIPTAQLSLAEVTCFFDTRPTQLICWKVAEGEMPGALFFYKELQRLYEQGIPPAPKLIDYPKARKGKGP